MSYMFIAISSVLLKFMRFVIIVLNLHAIGYLVSTDAYMNLQLANTEEYVDGNFTGMLGEVLIRCNNVLYIRGVPDEDMNNGNNNEGGENDMDEEKQNE